ncbi:MAG TPA: TetR/AcrR family transcriptional regulator [Rickettsiales bacterium]|nr:TetR/AcrR family transcriptional regulator [Rickettsiales bacterium]
MRSGRPRKFEREAALDIALKLFWQHGYEGTSVARLAEAIGINPPSLYAAFGSKEALFIEAIKRYGDMHCAFYPEVLAQKTAYDVARKMLEEEVELVTKRDHPNGCLVVQGALVTSPESEAIRAQVSDMRNMAEQWLCERFKKAKKEGDLPQDADPAALACYLMTLNSGLAVQAKSGVSRKRLKQVVEIALSNWPNCVS